MRGSSIWVSSSRASAAYLVSRLSWRRQWSIALRLATVVSQAPALRGTPVSATASARRPAPPAPGPRPARRRRPSGSASRRSWRPPSATPHRRSAVDRWRARAYCAEMDNARVEALLAREPRVILGITGPPGAGKTRLARVGRVIHSMTPSSCPWTAFISPTPSWAARPVGPQRRDRHVRRICGTSHCSGCAAPPPEVVVMLKASTVTSNSRSLFGIPAAGAEASSSPRTRIRPTTSRRGPARAFALGGVVHRLVPREERRRRLVAQHIQSGKSP